MFTADIGKIRHIFSSEHDVQLTFTFWSVECKILLMLIVNSKLKFVHSGLFWS